MNEQTTSAWQRPAVLRVLDANLNRATEGLRVLEDHVRFLLDDAHLSALCKNLRHELVAVLQAVSPLDLWAARDTLSDVGTTIRGAQEYQRETLGDVVAANSRRVEQSLRCLEEFAKVLSPEMAAQLEQLRYRAYTVTKAIAISAASGQRLRNASLYVLLDGANSPAEFADRVRMLITAGVHVIQLREKHLGDRELLARARVLVQLTRSAGVLSIVNDRPDLAVLADADGVHVGQEELTVKDAREIVGTRRLIGVSTHTLPQAQQAVLDGANYIGCGPTFPSTTKTFDHFPGLDFLREVTREIRLPAFAIGGITADNLPEVVAAGFRRVAVSGALTNAVTPEHEVQRLLMGLTDQERKNPGTALGHPWV